MRIQPQAVIFDYGLVLCDPQPKADVEAMAELLQMDFRTFLRFVLAVSARIRSKPPSIRSSIGMPLLNASCLLKMSSASSI